MRQQREAATLGMWIFLATEVMFFGVLFLGFSVYRAAYPEAFAEASRHTDLLLGSVNTIVLLTSSLTMALAVHAAQTGRRKTLVVLLLFTMLLGTVFLGIKGVEYYEKYAARLVPALNFTYPGDHPEQAELYFYLYFAMTGLHGLHIFAGISVLAVIAFLARRGRFSPRYYTPVELTGLYWHFVDIVWVFLFPLLYLIGGR
jgi:cytochrome c oxidase subunit 3